MSKQRKKQPFKSITTPPPPSLPIPLPSTTPKYRVVIFIFFLIGFAIYYSSTYFLSLKSQEDVKQEAVKQEEVEKITVSIELILKQGKGLSPFEALDLYTNYLKSISREETLNYALLNEVIGDTYHALQRYSLALPFHLQALSIKKLFIKQISFSEIIIAHTQVITDLYLNFEFEKALDLLHEIQRICQNVKDVPKEATSLLFKLESAIYECKGDFISALFTFENAIKMAPHTGQTEENVMRHLTLLQRTQQSEQDLPLQVSQSMKKKIQNLTTELLRRGPWINPLQLPQTYIPGLRSQAWHQLEEYPELIPLAKELQASTSLLLQEFLLLNQTELSSNNNLFHERECIQDIGRGTWRRHEITGYWHPWSQQNNCSIVTPIACELLSRLRKINSLVIRAGYSAIGPGAWLKPHCGRTNGQLKFHLGLIIPKGRCTKIRVANEIRYWKQNQILFFDDSFEHEVWNHCPSERVVFQVVFAHPDLPQLSSSHAMSTIFGTHH